MKKSITTTICVMLFLVLGCSKKSESGSGQSPAPRTFKGTSISKAVLSSIESTAKKPSKGEFVELNYPMYYDVDSQTECEYTVDEREEIVASDDVSVEIKLSRKANAMSYNSSSCPGQHPELIVSENARYTAEEYRQRNMRMIKKVVDPEVYLNQISWAQSVEVLSFTKDTRFNTQVYVVKTLVTSTSGVNYEIESVVSVHSQLLGLMERTRTRLSDGNVYRPLGLNHYRILNPSNSY